jgi:sulfide:quinone oxidoreductase
LRVVVVGGGFAAVETLLALRALAGDGPRVDLVAPVRELTYRPAATAEAFTDVPPERYDLAAIAADMGATHRYDRLDAVAPHTRSIRLAGHAHLDYDVLVLALGARAVTAVSGATTFRDQRDVGLVRDTLAGLRSGEIERLAFAVPNGCSWPLPLYELALSSAAEAARARVDAEITIVTPERAPLELFGAQAAELMAGILSDHRVRFAGRSAPSSLERDGRLRLHDGGALRFDRVIAAPRLVGPRIAGVPGSWGGFTPVDSRGRVEGLSDVYAAGDMTTFPLKQGGLATQQADVIAHQIASRAGAAVHELDLGLVVRARLRGGSAGMLLRTELTADGRPAATTIVRPDGDDERAPKVFGRYLTPYLESGRAAALAV